MNQRIFLVCPVIAALASVGIIAAAETGQTKTLGSSPQVDQSIPGGQPELWVSPTELPPLELGAKPVDSLPERRAHAQATLPTGVTELPFVETAPEPALTEAEKQRGYLLFTRPTVEPVYPNSRPLAEERVTALTTFAAPGQFQPLNLAIYPVRPLVNLKVRASALTSAAGEIPTDRVDIRLATYWNVGHPRYVSLKTYRRTPELLERVTVHSSPAHECQRYWLTVHVPYDANPGVYKGTVTLWDDGFDRAISVPVALRVLSFRLLKDPAKHFSAYYYTLNRSWYRGRSDEFIRKAADNDYRTMVDFGLDMLPTLHLSCDRDGQIVLRYAEEVARMLSAGLRGPAPVTADGVIDRIYRDTTPNGKRGEHWKISETPPPAFYQRVTEAFQAFEADRKAKGWPEFVYCPMDEVDDSCADFGVKVYAAVKAAGVRTYATKDPAAKDAAAYAPYLDIWCSQPYSVPYEQIAAQDRHEYWCYPNHNAGEIKDRLTMCKGGRMTYGFGFWRSGYTTLIPWDWNWTCAADQFDYLRGSHSGCGQRMDDEGHVIPAVYWACFREGYDDARYIYTLQQAIVQRQDSADPACQAAIRAARQLLRDTWDSIHVQRKYLATGMWPSREFDVVRWRLANETEKLSKYPATSNATAPSVLLDAGDKRGETRDKPVKTVSESEAVELTKKELLKIGLKVEDYRMEVKASSDGKRWLVFFDPKVQLTPGGGRWVTVDKASGKTVFGVGD